MSRDVVCGIDVGTTSIKTVLTDKDGHTVASGASDAIPTDTSTPGRSEQDPEQIWSAVAQAVRRALDSAATPMTVQAVAMAAQSGSVVPVTAAGARPAVTWMDTRSADLVGTWPASTKETIRSISGWPASPGLGLATISSLRASGRADGVTRWASVDDYLVHELTGSWITNPSNALGMQLLDAASGRWSETLCDLAGVQAAELSEIAQPGAVAGPLSAPAASRTGLPVGTPVVVGGHDQACSALGLGAVATGDAILSVGTAWVLTVVTDAPPESVPAGFSLGRHVVDGSWTVSNNLGPLGAIVAWALREFPGTDEDAAEPATSSVDACMFVPAAGGTDRSAWGTFTGAAGNADDRRRAVFESCAFEVRVALDALAADIALGDQLRVVGGGQRSRALIHLIANATDRDLHVATDISWAALGAADLAARSIGWPGLEPEEGSVVVVQRQPTSSTAQRRFDIYQDLVQQGAEE